MRSPRCHLAKKASLLLFAATIALSCNARSGDLDSYELGLAYLKGEGVEWNGRLRQRDISEALKMFESAASEEDQGGGGHEKALEVLMTAYYEGDSLAGQKLTPDELESCDLEKDLSKSYSYAKDLVRCGNEGWFGPGRESTWKAQMILCTIQRSWFDAAIAKNDLPNARRHAQEYKDVSAALLANTNVPPKILEDIQTAVSSANEAFDQLPPEEKRRNPTVAEIGAMFDGASQKLNSNANVEDPEPEKFGGPDTQTVIRLANLGLATAGNPSMVMTIKRGQPLVANVLSEIPEGTKVFPIRIKTGLVDFDYSFYLDPFEEWQMQSPRGSGGFGMEPVN